MIYVSISDVRERLPLITEAVRTDAQIESFIDDVDAVTDGYLRGVYVLPLIDPIDPLITYVALELTCGLVLENVYGEESPNDVAQPRFLKERALRLLDGMRSGRILLDHGAYPGESAPAVTRESVLSEDTERSLFSVDSDVLGPAE
jgi:phage gp36-like protein